MAPSSSYYIVGGTLPKNATCYIMRAADAQLPAHLRAGAFCYVFNTRQIGKSSLMVRTAQRLREEGIQVALLDLTAIGQNVTVEEWYDGLLTLVGEQLHLEDALEDFWREHRHLGPMQRWMQALTQVVLKQSAQPLCVFVDEIDAVRSLPFSTNEFFAGIRECYNRRTQNPLFERLTFCLLGVAAPVDLISDPLISPFNIGKRIVLTDFTRAEAASLAHGFDEPPAEAQQNREEALDRLLTWTDGHPYLTQRLCEELAQSPGIPTQRDVDAACERLFLSKQAQRTDDNLVFVRNRLLHDAASRAAILDLYRRLLQGRKIEEDTTDPRHTALQLAGIVRMQDGLLVVRNRIYAHVFDQAWALANMPVEEIQRQRAAYRRGVLRSALVFGGLAALIASVLAVTVISGRRTLAAEQRAAQSLYVSDMNLIQREWENGNATHVFELLQETRGSAGRGIEWDYWNRQCHQSRYTLSLAKKGTAGSPPERVMAVVQVPGQQQVAILGEQGSLRWIDIATGQVRRTMNLNLHVCRYLAYSPDGSRLLVGGDGSAQIRDSKTGALVEALPGNNDDLKEAYFAPDGMQVVGLSQKGYVFLWDLIPSPRQKLGSAFHTHKDFYFQVAFTQDYIALFRRDGEIEMRDRKTGQERRRLAGFRGGSAAFSHNGKQVVGIDGNGNLLVRNVKTGQTILQMDVERNLSTACFSPDDRRILTGEDNTIKVWDASDGRLLHVFREHTEARLQMVSAGRYVVSGGYDGLIKGWDLEIPSNPQILPAGVQPLWSVAYSPDGTRLLTSSADGRVIFWDTATQRQLRVIQASDVRVAAARFSHNGRFLFTGDDHGVGRLWDVETGKQIRSFTGFQGPINSAVFSPDDREIYAGSDDRTALKWDTTTAEALRRFPGGKKSVEALALTQDGKRLVTGDDDQTTRIWNTQTAAPLPPNSAGMPPYVSPAEIWGLALSPDDRYLAIGNLRNTVEVWDLTDRKRTTPQVLRGHTDWVVGVVFSPDGKRLATTSRDATVRVWEVETWREVLTLTGHKGQVSNVAFSPQGDHIAAVGKDGDLMIWDMTPMPSAPDGRTNPSLH